MAFILFKQLPLGLMEAIQIVTHVSSLSSTMAKPTTTAQQKVAKMESSGAQPPPTMMRIRSILSVPSSVVRFCGNYLEVLET